MIDGKSNNMWKNAGLNYEIIDLVNVYEKKLNDKNYKFYRSHGYFP